MQTKIGFILDSTKAFAEYLKATGELPPVMPTGKNTLRTEFVVDLDGTSRAAMLIKQRGFEQTAEEKARGEEADGLSVMIATDLDVDAGKLALREVSAKILWPNEKQETP